MIRREIAPNIMETVIENPSDKLLAICRKDALSKNGTKRGNFKENEGSYITYKNLILGNLEVKIPFITEQGNEYTLDLL